MLVRQRVSAVQEAKAEVLAHCMCAKLEESDGHYLAYYPPGYYFGGCRVSKGMGKAKALMTLREKMEEHWKAEQV